MAQKFNRHEYEHSTHSDAGGDGHGGEENWLVSYADMMTLLVGFFVILLSFSTVDQEKFEEAKKSITKEFGGAYEKPFAAVADKIKDALSKAGHGDQFVVKTDESGVEISFLGTAFFASGSVDFKDGARDLFDALIKEIQIEVKDFNIVIEGHTDDVPLGAGGILKNNWELSSIRACRVLDYFLLKGFAKEKMTAVGYGEARPLVPNRDLNGTAIPENQSQNRRVIIKLLRTAMKTI